MLPDLPGLKRDIQRVLDHYLQKQIEARLGVFNQSSKHTAHEGDRMRIIRSDGSVDDSDFKEASAEFSLKLDEVPRLTINERVAKLDNMAEDIARQVSENLFRSLNDTLNKAGQVIDRHGEPFDADAVFTALENIQLDFDETGLQNQLSIVIPPALMPRAKQVFEQIESDPKLRERHKEIIERKREEWRDREVARKLVG